MDKNHPGVAKIFKRIMEMYESGRCTTISDEEMEKLARRYLSELFISEFDELKGKAYNLAAHLAADLALSDDIRSLDPARMEPILQKSLDNFPFIQFMYIVNLDGRKITRNITHIVDRAKYAEMKLEEDLSNRSWFIEPIKTGKVFVSDFYTSRFTGALCITVSVPVRNDADEIQAILGLDIRFEALAKMEQEGEI